MPSAKKTKWITGLPKSVHLFCIVFCSFSSPDLFHKIKGYTHNKTENPQNLTMINSSLCFQKTKVSMDDNKCCPTCAEIQDTASLHSKGISDQHTLHHRATAAYSACTESSKVTKSVWRETEVEEERGKKSLRLQRKEYHMYWNTEVHYFMLKIETPVSMSNSK